jgi:hypothetical protein
MYTLHGKTWQTRHMHPTLDPHMTLDHTYLPRSAHNSLLLSHQQSWAGPPLPRKRATDLIHSVTIDRSVSSYPVSLPTQSLKQWGQSQSLVDDGLLGLPSPSLRHVISTFNTCSQGPTHRSLTDTDEGYNLGGAGFPHHTPQPSQPTVLRFPTKGPSGLRLSILNIHH